jgi:hypothetical protein
LIVSPRLRSSSLPTRVSASIRRSATAAARPAATREHGFVLGTALLVERQDTERRDAWKAPDLQSGEAPSCKGCGSLLSAVRGRPRAPCRGTGLAYPGMRCGRSRPGGADGFYGLVERLVHPRQRERYELRDLGSLLGTSPQVPDPVPMPLVLLTHVPHPITGSAVAIASTAAGNGRRARAADEHCAGIERATPSRRSAGLGASARRCGTGGDRDGSFSTPDAASHQRASRERSCAR